MSIINQTQKARNIFIICMISVLMGQFYISPFNTVFRLTFAVYFMTLFLIYFENYGVLLITLSVGFSTFLFRSIVYYLGSGLPFYDSMLVYLPIMSFYIFFGLMFKYLSVRSYYNQPFNFFLSLWVCDSVANITEAIVRRTWETTSFEGLVFAIILIGGGRTVLTLLTYYSIKRYHSKLKKHEQDKYFNELVFFISKLKTELFFLNKSRSDIEETVAYAYEHYNLAESESEKAPFLKIAKDIHEIKKDYLRVITGMNQVFGADSNIKFMSIQDILFIVKDNINKLVLDQGKKIEIVITDHYHFTTSEFYTIISILNNLAVNSMDAIPHYGEIEIRVDLDSQDKSILFEVFDTGEGITDEKKIRVFDVGYTTKYDKMTGKMSSGIGLSHVQQLVTEFLTGSITIESAINKGTRAIVRIPQKRLMSEEN